MRFFLPVAVAVTAAVTYALRRHQRRQWERRKISGGRKALLLNLVDRR